MKKVCKKCLVFYDELKHRYIVIDGNHRLKAMKDLYKPETIINVREIYYE